MVCVDMNPSEMKEPPWIRFINGPVVPQTLRTSGQWDSHTSMVLQCRLRARLQGLGSEVRGQAPTSFYHPTQPPWRGVEVDPSGYKALFLSNSIRNDWLTQKLDFRLTTPFPILFSWFLNGHLENIDFCNANTLTLMVYTSWHNLEKNSQFHKQVCYGQI